MSSDLVEPQLQTLGIDDVDDALPLTLPADSPSVSVVIPTKNEARNLPWVFARLPIGLAEVIVVDANSTDGTVDVARRLRPDVRVVEQSRTGKGNALACGIAVARGDVIVTLDADGSADPAEILPFVAALTSGADFAKGSRFRRGGGSTDITRFRRLGNAVLCGFVNSSFETEYTDLCYGFNAFWSHCVPHLALPAVAGADAVFGDGFEIETLINLRAAMSPLSVVEVPSFELPRRHGSSNLNAVRDGFRVLRMILRERSLNRRGALAPASVIPYPSPPLESRRTTHVA